MRLIHLHAIVVVVVASPVFGQTQVDRFENLTKSSATGAAGAATGAADDPASVPGSGFLGLEPDEKDKSGKGTPVLSVRKGGPAELAGLRAGDLITAINSKPCRTVKDLDAVLDASSAGTKLTMTIVRLGKPETKTVTLGRKEAAPTETGDAAATAPLPTPPRPGAPALSPAASTTRTPLDDPPAAAPPTLRPATDPPGASGRKPALDLPPPPPGGDKPTTDPPTAEPPATDTPAPAGTGRASLGIQVVPLNDDTRIQYDVRSVARQGALIVSVRPGSPADTAGLPLGGVVVSIDGQLVKTSDDLVDAISAMQPGREVELRYYQDDRPTPVTKSLRLAPAAARGVAPPPRPGLTLDPGGPLTRRFEDLVDSPEHPPRGTPLSPGTLSARPAVGSGIAEVGRITELLDQINMLKTQLEQLEERVKQLEGKGAAPPPPLPGNP